jgi:hypothetical protein
MQLYTRRGSSSAASLNLPPPRTSSLEVAAAPASAPWNVRAGGANVIDCTHSNVSTVPFQMLADSSDEEDIEGEKVPPAPTSKSAVLQLQYHLARLRTFAPQALANVMGGTLTSTLVLVMNVTYASVVFFKDSPLEGFVPHGISACLSCTALAQLGLLALGSPVPYIVVADSFMAVLFAEMNHDILEAHEAPLASQLATTFVAMALCSLLLSLSYVALGTARLAKIGQYVPSPVLAGYQASIGWLLLDSCVAMSAGCSLLAPECLAAPPRQLRLGLALSFGAALFVAQRCSRGILKFLLMPALLVSSVLAFHVARPHLADADEWTLRVAEGQSLRAPRCASLDPVSSASRYGSAPHSRRSSPRTSVRRERAARPQAGRGRLVRRRLQRLRHRRHRVLAQPHWQADAVRRPRGEVRCAAQLQPRGPPVSNHRRADPRPVCSSRVL